MHPDRAAFLFIVHPSRHESYCAMAGAEADKNKKADISVTVFMNISLLRHEIGCVVVYCQQLMIIENIKIFECLSLSARYFCNKRKFDALDI